MRCMPAREVCERGALMRWTPAREAPGERYAHKMHACL
jgi:hypothetical protein